MAMAGRQLGAVIQRIERLFASGSVAGLSEGQLLERFAAGGDQAAFEAIVARHGPMVLGICRRLLRDPHDVEDAFQATFLVLVRKAGSLRRRDLLGNWLFGVASRVARRARAVAARRRSVEGPGGAPVDEAAGVPENDSDHELEAQLHEEIRRLPAKYRIPVLLCYLEGLTHEEAARQLRWPLGTVKGRLARAREVLRRRLTRRGLTLPAAAVSAAVARQAEAMVPTTLTESTINAALAVAAARGLAAGAVAANVIALANGGSSAMSLNAVKLVAMVVVAGVLATGAGVVAFQDPTRPGASRPNPRLTQVPPKSVETARGVPVKREGREAIAVLAPQVAARDQSPAARAVLAKLEEPVSMSFANATPLEDVLRYIKAATQGPNDTGIKIYLDPVALKESKIDPHTATVTMDVEGVPLRISLRLALKQLGLAYCVRDRMVIISSVEGVLQELREAEAEAEAAETAQATTKPAPGAAPAPGPERSQPAPTESDPGQLKSQALEKRLDEPIQVAFSKETPLEDVLAYLKNPAQASDAPELPIYVDPSVRDKLKSLVQLDLPGAPLRTSLTLLLGQVDLVWGVQDGLLIVSDRARLGTIGQIAFQLAHGPVGPNLGGAPRDQEILAKLAAPITLSFPRETPLNEIINRIRHVAPGPDHPSIPIYLGAPALANLRRPSTDTAGLTGPRSLGSLPVQIDIKDVPIRTCLALVLAQPEVFGPMGGTSALDARVLGGVVIIGETSWLQSHATPEGGFGSGVGRGMMGGMMGGPGMM
jgi:RNA polymerase sigma factor (sigma-70 family)